MKKRQKTLFGFTVLVTAAICILAGCGGDPDGGPAGGNQDLSGNISISPASAAVGTPLNAVYTGTETVTYQWKRGNANVGTNSPTHTPDQAGTYTVTVSAAGYNSKTSAAINVTGGGGVSIDRGPGTGGNPVLATGEIWVDDKYPTEGTLFDSDSHYVLYLANGKWGSRFKEGTWSGTSIIFIAGSENYNYTFTVNGNKLYIYNKNNSLTATFTKTTGQTITGQDSNWPSGDLLTEYGIAGMTASALTGATNISYTGVTGGKTLWINFTGTSATDTAVAAWFSSNGWTKGSTTSAHSEYSKTGFTANYIFAHPQLAENAKRIEIAKDD